MSFIITFNHHALCFRLVEFLAPRTLLTLNTTSKFVRAHTCSPISLLRLYGHPPYQKYYSFAYLCQYQIRKAIDREINRLLAQKKKLDQHLHKEIILCY